MRLGHCAHVRLTTQADFPCVAQMGEHRPVSSHKNPIEQALDVFVSIYGAEAGNLALKFKATGGVFVGGGIAPKIVEKLKAPVFIEAFKAKGRMRRLLEAVPLRVIMNDKTALLGAARRALLQGTVVANTVR